MWFDIGVNLNSTQFDHDRELIVMRAREAGVQQQLLIASDVAESIVVQHLAQQFGLYASAGVHPHQASSWNDDSKAALMPLLALPRVVAVGECGLDYNRNFSPPAQQRIAFMAQLAIASEGKKTVYLHCRDAHDDFIQILDKYRRQLPSVIVHCFTGSKAELHDLIVRDCYIGITGWIGDERRGQHLHEAVRDIPLNRLLLETDAPYLLPRDMKNKPSSRRNEPCYLPHVAQTVASALKLDIDVLEQHCWENSHRAFGLAK